MPTTCILCLLRLRAHYASRRIITPVQGIQHTLEMHVAENLQYMNFFLLAEKAKTSYIFSAIKIIISLVI